MAKNGNVNGRIAAVSIVMPAYNAERFIVQALASVVNQSHRNWKLLVIIDKNSRDHTEEIARRLGDLESRVLVVVGETEGVSANRNLGVALADGDYLCFLDSDDWWAATKLERQLAFMEKMSVDWSFTGYCVMSEDGKRKVGRLDAKSVVRHDDLLRGVGIGCLSVMFSRRLYQSLRFRDENHEDFALWLRLLRAGQCAYGLNEQLCFYRRVGGSRSSNKLLAALWRWQILRRQEKVPVVEALRYMLAYGKERTFRIGSNESDMRLM